jgi:diguanylate cyclase (GGDEF)-like protein
MSYLDELNRLAALDALDMIGAPREPALDRIAQIVRNDFDARHAGIMIVDRTTAVFAARANVMLKSLPRDEAFCSITIQKNDPLIIHDTLIDPRVAGHAQVARGIRSYAGVPLRTREGYNIGSLCVFDTDLLSFTPEKIHKMEDMALLAMECIELRRLAIQDHLTGAMNRRGFMTELEREFLRHGQGQGTLALALMDLDHFKQINDRFGHPVGDKVLQSLVKIVTDHCQRSEVIGRLGGEEFGILMPGYGGQAAFEFIEKLRLEIEKLRWAEVPDLRITASFGISQAGPRNRDCAALMTSADTALYRAKASSRNATVMAQAHH